MKIKKPISFILGIIISAGFMVACTAAPAQLTAPAALQITGTSLTWDAVSNASGYWVQIDENTPVHSATTSYSLSSLAIGDYSIKIKAKGNGTKYIDSEWSAAIPYCAGTPGLAFELIDGDTAYSVSKGTALASAVVIPSLYSGLPVTEIKATGFQALTSMVSITVPAGVEKIGFAAFNNCSNLAKITIPFIGKDGGDESGHFGYIFGAADSLGQNFLIPQTLKTVIITSGSTVRQRAFFGCSNIESIVLSDNAASISQYAFSSCTALESIRIPSGVAAIADYAFDYCTALSIVYCDSASWTPAFIGTNNTALSTVTKYVYSANPPSAAGNYWRYVDGIPAVWTD